MTAIALCALDTPSQAASAKAIVLRAGEGLPQLLVEPAQREMLLLELGDLLDHGIPVTCLPDIVIAPFMDPSNQGQFILAGISRAMALASKVDRSTVSQWLNQLSPATARQLGFSTLTVVQA